ncbi:hypothetical protein [Seonamhaeicola aphaedonensis]|uniref:Secreted protein (Por secretion system target) n=1 Tax=Seonamhaeicola aphaedonensis TaxID=1461338 RepID=A0A3D9HER4_9FLAO|nr:hypothetical protein [Seonamhaeicola aphaedonensis]RED47982.1 hypothetical protein DFQ02_105211 [Seonamhaeicola aphaedonensis]
MMKITTYLYYCIIGVTIAFSSIHKAEAQNDMQKIQIDFTMPNGFVRHLLIGFTPDNAASDGVDYGYDAINRDIFPDDLNWMIDNNRYVIQGVGAFDDTKQYSLGMFLQNSGNIKIKLAGTYNFPSSTNMYIYDSEERTYTKINDTDFDSHMPSGEYTDRFYLAFKETSEPIVAKNSLSTNDEILASTKVHYSKKSNELIISTNNNIKIEAIDIYNIASQNLYSKKTTAYSGIKIPLSLNSNAYYIINLLTDRGLLTKKIMVL